MATVIITVRMNEASMREANPHVPWSPEEIAADAARCVEAGAAVVHFHGRDPVTGGADRSPEALATTVELIDGVERRHHLLQPRGRAPASTSPIGSPRSPTTGRCPSWRRSTSARSTSTPSTGRRGGSPPRRASTSTRSPPSGGWSTGIVAAGVTPVAVAWGIGSLRLLDALVLQGAWPTPVVGELVVSDALLSTNPATPAGLGALLPFVPEVEASWSLMCALGSVLPLADAAFDAGLGISVGLGDHPHTELGAPTNAELVARAAEHAVAAGHRVAGPAEARGLLGLPPR